MRHYTVFNKTLKETLIDYCNLIQNDILFSESIDISVNQLFKENNSINLFIDDYFDTHVSQTIPYKNNISDHEQNEIEIMSGYNNKYQQILADFSNNKIIRGVNQLFTELYSIGNQIVTKIENIIHLYNNIVTELNFYETLISDNSTVGKQYNNPLIDYIGTINNKLSYCKSFVTNQILDKYYDIVNANNEKYNL